MDPEGERNMNNIGASCFPVKFRQIWYSGIINRGMSHSNTVFFSFFSKVCNLCLTFANVKLKMLNLKAKKKKKILVDSQMNIYRLRYTNADLRICHYLRLHMKIIFWRFHIKTHFTFWDMRTWVMWNVC